MLCRRSEMSDFVAEKGIGVAPEQVLRIDVLLILPDWILFPQLHVLLMHLRVCAEEMHTAE